MAVKKREKAGKRKPKLRYEPEVVYQYWAAAGGCVQEAMRKAKDADDERVPNRADTWADYATKHGFSARLAAEEKARWEKFHQEREERQQQVLDGIAHSFEQVMGHLQNRFSADLTILYDESLPPGERAAAEKRLLKFFGSMDGVDRFYRMYLRSRGLPERLTHTKIDHGGAMMVTYGDLEGAVPKSGAKDAADARKRAGDAA